jgi:hypothetical protein
MARLVFLYVRDGAAPGIKYNPSVHTNNLYANRIRDEGYFYMLKRMVETKIIDELMIFIESNRAPGFIEYDKYEKIYGHVMPDIEELQNRLRPDDIIFVRGGWKSWHAPLKALKEKGHKVLIYAANTGRERWEFWDVIFNDLSGDNKIDAQGRLQFDFHKPTNPDLFHYIPDSEIKYDLCIGASHIHDKKGQHRAVEAVLKYKKIFGEKAMCIMPGSYRGGTKTLKMIEALTEKGLGITTSGMVDRKNLNVIYNQSKYFIHLGGGGQGDRGPIEAMSCGCNIILGNTRRHHRLLYENRYCDVVPDYFNNEDIARQLYYKFKTYEIENRQKIADYYQSVSGIETVILPEMKELFNKIKKGNIV